MGTVIHFPEGQRSTRNRYAGAVAEPAAVIILPVIRVERLPDDPSDNLESGPGASRRRRRRVSRS
jgi:hypothetical protein